MVSEIASHGRFNADVHAAASSSSLCLQQRLCCNFQVRSNTTSQQLLQLHILFSDPSHRSPWTVLPSNVRSGIHVAYCLAAAQVTMQKQGVCHAFAGSPMGQQAFPPLPQAAPAPRQPPPSGLQARPFINPLAAKAPAKGKGNVAKAPSQVFPSNTISCQQGIMHT